MDYDLVKIEKNASLREALDNIDSVIVAQTFNDFFFSRKRILIGIWEKGRQISENGGGSGGVKPPPDWSEMSRNTGRDRKDLRTWYKTFIDFPDIKEYEKVAEKKALAWTQKALEDKTKGAHVENNTGDNEWYTPPAYIEAARSVMKSIDLDPASSPEANDVVKAKKMFTAEDDGLSREWVGRVWMNPPYAQPLVAQFCGKLIQSYESGKVSEAIVLINNGTETNHFQDLAVYCSMICFPRGRVRFWAPNKETAAPLQGQALLYFGENKDQFLQYFKGFGLVVYV